MTWFWRSLNRLLESMADWIYYNKLEGKHLDGLVATEPIYLSRVMYVDAEGNETEPASVTTTSGPPVITWTNLPRGK